MSERDRGMALAMLAEAFGVKPDNLTSARIRIYDQALAKVPVVCLPGMAERAVRTRRPRWGDLPPVAQLLDDAETVRLELRAALWYQPCGTCAPAGWREVSVDGVTRLARCACWMAHQEQVRTLGGGHEPLALPAAMEEVG